MASLRDPLGGVQPRTINVRTLPGDDPPEQPPPSARAFAKIYFDLEGRISTAAISHYIRLKSLTRGRGLLLMTDAQLAREFHRSPGHIRRLNGELAHAKLIVRLYSRILIRDELEPGKAGDREEPRAIRAQTARDPRAETREAPTETARDLRTWRAVSPGQMSRQARGFTPPLKKDRGKKDCVCADGSTTDVAGTGETHRKAPTPPEEPQSRPAAADPPMEPQSQPAAAAEATVSDQPAAAAARAEMWARVDRYRSRWLRDTQLATRRVEKTLRGRYPAAWVLVGLKRCWARQKGGLGYLQTMLDEWQKLGEMTPCPEASWDDDNRPIVAMGPEPAPGAIPPGASREQREEAERRARNLAHSEEIDAQRADRLAELKARERALALRAEVSEAWEQADDAERQRWREQAQEQEELPPGNPAVERIAKDLFGKSRGILPAEDVKPAADP